ncbi:amino acid adenylation domain-containing protein [Flavobacterium sp.]|uniref:amino acid adenylation domain-containing protein n=1 Tax=Flavobacterium sp. TaxID=239 RepID=UPI003D6A6DC6
MKLTLPQQDIYFEQLLHPDEPIYNIGAKIEIKGKIDVELFKKAHKALIDQHDTYRSSLVKDQEEIRIKTIENHNAELGFIDFSQSINSEEQANSYMQKEFLIPFDILGGTLLHTFTLVKVEDDFHYLFSVYHHIITDGWGTSLMFQRLVQNYNEISDFGNVISEYPYRYEEFASDDSVYQNSVFFEQDKAYWKEKFNSLPSNLFEKLENTIEINKSARKELIISRESYDKLNQLATAYKATTFHVILGLLYVYFGRKHENNDFAIGLPVLNRSKAAYKKTVGLFMGISPLRISLDSEVAFESLIQDIKNQLRQDYRHQRLPLGKLIQELQLFGEKERLFNITLSYEKQDYASNFKNTQTKVIPLSHFSERVALAIYIREFDESEDVKIDFDYNLNYFDDHKISQVVRHFENLIDVILTDSDQKIKALDYLSKIEKKQILEEFNETKSAYPKDKTVIDLFVEKVRENPSAIAVEDDYKSYSYNDLHDFSNKIAEYLTTVHGDNKNPIAVLLDRSADMIAVLLGILKSGRSYIPLDPNFPKDRLKYIVQDSQVQIIISGQDFTFDGIEAVSEIKLDHILEEIKHFEGNSKFSTITSDTAYIIYTSGSTGNPKGVEIGHQSLLNFLTSMQQKPGISAEDILFSVTTYSFDISILEFFTPLISGAVLYMASQEVLSDPLMIIQKLEEIQPTLIQATPSFYQMLFNANWQGDKKVKLLCGGDLLSEALAGKMIDSCKEIWNMYGPTETTIWSSCKKIEQPKDASNIGTPINNTQFYILDRFLHPKPIGAIGAIYIAGDGLSKGYYKNEALTNTKFVKNPFGNFSLLYETGDVGKWNKNGEIEFLGRNDNQVKIRGYRIELGDIESRLNQITGIKNSVVIVKANGQQEAFLLAYVVKTDKELSPEQIITELKINLPAYMIPHTIVELDKFPLTPNQKVDRKSLQQKELFQDIKDKTIKAPDSELEKKLLEYWKEALNNTNEISTDDNFFAVGGHSLNAVKLIGLIAKHLSFAISFKTIFDFPTIESLAFYLQKQTTTKTIEIPVAESKELFELTPSQYNIWLASQQASVSTAYNMFAAFSVDGHVDLDKMVNTVKELIKKHEILRTNFVERNGNVYQKINDFENINFSIDVKNSAASEIDATINQFINEEFDLQNGLLIKLQLLCKEDDTFILLFCTHHIIIDGMSLELFVKEFTGLYDTGIHVDKNLPVLQFKDYSEWSNLSLKENVAKNELFWGKYLQNYHYKDSFDRDFNLEKNLKNGQEHLFELSEETTSNLKEAVLQQNVTFYTFLMAALNVLLYKECNHTDICIGTVNSGRILPQLDNQIGMFAKTLILRTKMEPEQTFAAIVKNVQSDLFEMEAHIDVPFDKVAMPIFDAMLVYQNPEFSFENIEDFNNLKLTQLPINEKYSRMPIVFNFYECMNRLKCAIDYNNNLFEEDTIAVIAEKFELLLNGIVEKPFEKIESYQLQLESEKDKVNDFEFNF